MRFISMVKSNEAKMGMPPKALMDAMDQLIQEMAKAGCTMVEGVGLHPTSAGMRVRLTGGKLTVTDGPFTEAKEVVGGFAIFEAPSKAEMLKWTQRFMALHKTHMPGWDGECEVRQIAGPGEKLCEQAREAQPAAV
jgi:hypothetical protein